MYANTNYTFLDFISELTNIKIQKNTDIFVISSVVNALAREIFNVEASTSYDSEIEELYEKSFEKIKDYYILRNSLGLIKIIFNIYHTYKISCGIYVLLTPFFI